MRIVIFRYTERWWKETSYENFVPYRQRKTYDELRPGDIIRAEGRYYIIVEARRGRRPYDYTATAQANLLELTGSMTDRFVHIDKFAMDVLTGTYTVSLRFAGVDVTGKQYGHVWTEVAADPADPTELDVVSFTVNDILTIIVTATVVGSMRAWFSYEEYVLQEVKNPVPDKYKIVTRYGWSRLITRAEDEMLGISTALRA